MFLARHRVCQGRLLYLHPRSARARAVFGGFTLVEMLVAMAITLVMMAAVVTLFANVSKSIQNRRATIEVDSQLRHVRNVLQQDLANATCPALTWQRPENNRGYIEIIEGLYSDQNPSIYTDGDTDTENDNVTPGTSSSPFVPGESPDELDPVVSFVPRGNNGQLMVDVPVPPGAVGSTATVPSNGLGDWDDILALTCRNEAEPFVGRVPTNVRTYSGSSVDSNPEDYSDWKTETIRSPLAEVVWFAVENPMNDTGRFMGEPGFRTIYRRVLLVAPWLNPYRGVNSANPNQPSDFFGTGANRVRTKPGVVRVLQDSVNRDDLPGALAALVSFQERYDLSVRLEFDPSLGGDGRWVIIANTLGDLTKRENRFGHVGLRHDGTQWVRSFPFAIVAGGVGYSSQNPNVFLIADPELVTTRVTGARANGDPDRNNTIVSYRVTDPNTFYPARPFAYVDDEDGFPSATANAILNDNGQVVHVTKGPVPLWGPRRGEDVVLSNVLAFDLRVYDPGAPLYPEPGIPLTIPPGSTPNPNYPGTVLDPGDAGWAHTAMLDTPANGTSYPNPVGVGAYVDLGYWNAFVDLGIRRDYWTLAQATNPSWTYYNGVGPLANPSTFGFPLSIFARAPSVKSRLDNSDAYRVYDTWSFHYENNGLNEDNDYYTTTGNPPMIDEGTNGLDDASEYWNAVTKVWDRDTRLGPDDVGERETSPPYDVPLRGIQVKLRVYERDSRQIRESVVQQHFVPE